MSFKAKRLKRIEGKSTHSLLRSLTYQEVQSDDESCDSRSDAASERYFPAALPHSDTAALKGECMGTLTTLP